MSKLGPKITIAIKLSLVWVREQLFVKPIFFSYLVESSYRLCTKSVRILQAKMVSLTDNRGLQSGYYSERSSSRFDQQPSLGSNQSLSLRRARISTYTMTPHLVVSTPQIDALKVMNYVIVVLFAFMLWLISTQGG